MRLGDLVGRHLECPWFPTSRSFLDNLCLVRNHQPLSPCFS